MYMYIILYLLSLACNLPSGNVKLFFWCMQKAHIMDCWFHAAFLMKVLHHVSSGVKQKNTFLGTSA